METICISSVRRETILKPLELYVIKFYNIIILIRTHADTSTGGESDSPKIVPFMLCSLVLMSLQWQNTVDLILEQVSIKIDI